jgi:glycosyltransferase involved in cell wall biosynthesis
VVEWASADRRVPADRVFLWPNVFDLDAVRAEGGDQGPPEEPPLRLISVGRLVEQKAYDVLIEALGLADADLPEWRLEILGSEDGWRGNWEARMKAMIEERGLGEKVKLVGHLENPHESIKRSHLFLHPARWEAFGNVIVETMALGTPVLATTCPGAPREILDGGRYGRLVPNEDPEAFAAALVELANDPDERKRLGEAGKGRAEDYSVDRLLPGMLADIERVTGADFGRSRRGDGGSPQPPGAER